ncbi:MAG: hypothetical protein QM767_22140 [Anaeromyxobacter sp.]
MLEGGTPPWAQSDTFTGAPRIPLALRSATLGNTLMVPTDNGWLHAIDADTGLLLWSTSLSATHRALQPANVAPRPGGLTSALYVTGADGKLTALVVDGVLDPDAPWPKAFHDPQNTSNAGSAP